MSKTETQVELHPDVIRAMTWSAQNGASAEQLQQLLAYLIKTPASATSLIKSL